jgi:hypothetical protein
VAFILIRVRNINYLRAQLLVLVTERQFFYDGGTKVLHIT